MDKFPEAFERFEKVVDVEEIKSFAELRLAFSSWAGKKWMPTDKQIEALNVEAQRLGLVWGMEKAMVKGKPQIRYRDVKTGRFVKAWSYARFTVKGKMQGRYRDVRTGRFMKKP